MFFKMFFMMFFKENISLNVTIFTICFPNTLRWCDVKKNVNGLVGFAIATTRSGISSCNDDKHDKMVNIPGNLYCFTYIT